MKRLNGVLIVIMLLVGFVSLEAICLKVDGSAVALYGCQFLINNELFDYSDVDEWRTEYLYESTDELISNYSNMGFVPKLGIFGLSLFLTGLFPYSIFFVFKYDKDRKDRLRKLKERNRRNMAAEKAEAELRENERVVALYNLKHQ